MKSEENKTEPYLFTKGFLTGRKVPSDHVNTCAPAPLLLSEAFLSYNVVDDFIQQKVPLTGILYYLGLFVNEVLFDEKSRQCRHRRSEYFHRWSSRTLDLRFVRGVPNRPGMNARLSVTRGYLHQDLDRRYLRPSSPRALPMTQWRWYGSGTFLRFSQRPVDTSLHVS